MKRWKKVLRSITFGVGAVIFLLISLPKPPLLNGISFSNCVYDRNHHLLRLELADDEKYRVFVPLEKISPSLIESTLLYEDRYFYFHYGFNPISLGKAFLNVCTGRGIRFGASTITMQLARIRFHLHTRTWQGKLIQIARAIQLEWHYSKREILEAYLNLAPYGRNIEGAGAASLIYFGKEPEKLVLAEAMTLSVIPQNPKRRTPDSSTDRRPLLEARESLFNKWIKIHPNDCDKKLSLQLPLQVKNISDLPFLAPHFVESILQQEKDASSIVTTLDLDLQQLVEQQIAHYIALKSSIGINNAAVLLINKQTMEVLASVGSANYYDEEIDGQVNGTTMRRSPRSTLKPFVYALAFDQGIIHPNSLLKDTPTSFGGYNPENFDRHFSGPIKAKDALIQSRNIPAVYLASKLAAGKFYQLLKKGGVQHLKDESHYGLTAALGSIEVSMEELASLYAMLANHGQFRPLQKKLMAKMPKSIPLLSPEASFLTLDILQKCPRPDRPNVQGIKNQESPIAWKTGTSFSFRDAWTAGVFDNYVLVIWIGNFNGQSNPAFLGRSAAAPLFFSMIDAIRSTAINVEPLVPPIHALNLEQIDICTDSGELATSYCPNKEKGWFIPGVSPITECLVHRLVTVDNNSGSRVSDFASNISTHREINEFWTTDLLMSFKSTGIPRCTPLNYDSGCPIDQKTVAECGPEIISPHKGVVYKIRTSDNSHSTLALEAMVDASVKKIYWFTDTTFLGTAKAGEPLFWEPFPGSFTISVLDDHGQTKSQLINISLIE